MMRFEHLAVNVKDARAVVDWYVKTLGLVIKRQMTIAPYTTFLADADGNMMLEFYQQDMPVADYASIPSFSLHLAFLVDDMEGTRNKWIAGGGKADGDITNTPAGDRLAFVRDPWGFTLQLVQRQTRML
jgi:catechol 2,3-dioxygenase-like lactoylglutathione lyase family enzyme